jgi:CRP-like cAMP-binding protein
MSAIPPVKDLDRAMLDRAGLFRDLTADAAQAVMDKARHVQLEPGARLLNQGDPSNRLYLVRNGRIKVSRVSPEGRQTTLRFMGPGDLIGCAAVFRGIPYPATATAVSAALVLCWLKPDFIALMDRHPRLSRNALEAVSGRLEEFATRVEGATEPAPQRLASALLRLSPHRETGDVSADGFELAITRQELAELTGATLFTISRILSDWDRKGLVSSLRQRVVIHDPVGLTTIAAKHPDA